MILLCFTIPFIPEKVSRIGLFLGREVRNRKLDVFAWIVNVGLRFRSVIIQPARHMMYGEQSPEQTSMIKKIIPSQKH